MALDARIVMSWMAVAVAIVSAPVSGAPLAVGAFARSARLRVTFGGNATCPWQVSLLDAAGDDGGRQLCTGELGVSFGDPPSVAEFPTATSYPTFTTAVPLNVATQPASTAASDTSLKFNPETAKRSSSSSTAAAAAAAAATAATSPPEGYEHVGGAGFYKLHTLALPWHAARAACEQEGAHLLVLDSAGEARALQRNLALKGLTTTSHRLKLHAGFRLDLVTPQGERVTYESWSNSEYYSRFCGEVDDDFWMSYDDCSQRKMFICEYELGTVSDTPVFLPVPSPTSECSEVKKQTIKDRGYAPLVGWNRTYVKDMGTISTWNAAKEICEENGAQMITLDSDEKADALFEFLQFSNVTGPFFIGVKTGPPVTVLGERLEDKGYQRWTEKNHQEICFFSTKKLHYYSNNCEDGNYYKHPRTICQINVF